VAVERVVVHADVADAFVAALVEESGRWRPGNPADGGTRLGPLVDERAVESVLAHVRSAADAGARILTGGGRATGPGLDDGCFVEPTVLVDVTTDMPVWTEETFGPIVPVIVAESFDQALALADEGSYGLAATVLTGSMEHALRAADVLEVGTVKVNAVFGGAPGGSADPRRGSGTGRGYGPDLLGELTVLKTVHLEGLPVG
jgi:succinate-semialdehyde dehydrogenase/glutarate-semialdehyde dehydrogenase